MPNDTRVKLFTLLGDYPHTRALKSGALASELIAFDFAEIAPAYRGFKPLVREHRFDLSEVAIVTFLQAKAQGTPYALLPVTMMSRGQLHTIAYDSARGPLTPRDLLGRRVGVRAYSQTTGTWLRGMMQELYGIDPTTMHWVTFEDAHVAGYVEPPFVERAPAGKELVPMLLAGELDAAIIGEHFPDPRLKPLIPDAEAQNLAFAQAHGGVPINHMLVIREGLAGRADLLAELVRLLRLSKQAANANSPQAGRDPLRYGIAAHRRSLETVIDYAVRQRLIPRPFTVDELFSDAMRAVC